VLAAVGIFTFTYARGYSYLLDDSSACNNCHIMRDHYLSNQISSHRHAVCNDCHVPHDNIVHKYIIKGINGLHHSYAFTFKSVDVPMITAGDRVIVQHNCIRCHESKVSEMLRGPADLEQPGLCTRCHRTVGHDF
jgi:cytochrome c nitrite reductase small subunit